jgi:hypothetical protein
MARQRVQRSKDNDPGSGICNVCGSLANVDFGVPDNVRKTVVPSKYQNELVCVECFGNFACEKQIELFRLAKLVS